MFRSIDVTARRFTTIAVTLTAFAIMVITAAAPYVVGFALILE